MATREQRRSSSERLRDLSAEDGRSLLPFAGVAVGLAVWWLVTYLSTGVLANFAPSHSFATLADLLVTPEFYFEDVGASLVRFGGAFVLSVAVGLPVGVALGYFDVADRLSSVTFQFLRMVSPVAWFPVALLVFESGGHAAPIFIMFMGGVWPLMYNTAHGIHTIDTDWLRVAFSLGGDNRRVIRHVVLPGVVPDVLSGLRLSIGWMWILLVPAELLGVNSGLGYTVLDARYQFDYAVIPAVMLVIGFIGYWLDWSVRRLQARWSWD
ncbi:MAG: ABC transporter permease [Halobacteriota archaeon]